MVAPTCPPPQIGDGIARAHKGGLRTQPPPHIKRNLQAPPIYHEHHMADPAKNEPPEINQVVGGSQQYSNLLPAYSYISRPPTIVLVGAFNACTGRFELEVVMPRYLQRINMPLFLYYIKNLLQFP